MPKGTHGSADVDVHTRRVNYSSKTQPISEVLKEQFSVENMGPGLKRGMVLYLVTGKILELIGGKKKTEAGKKVHTKRGKSFLLDFNHAELTHRKGQDYENPVLTLHFKPGSAWRAEMMHYRHRLKQVLNKRLKCDFIREVRIY